VVVITTRGEEHDYGVTASAFSSVSLDPPLVLVCLVTSSSGTDHIRENRSFAINILGAHQEPISRYFSSKERPRGRDAFKEIPHRELVTGSPIIDEVAGFVDCTLHSSQEAGDHIIFIGEVVALGADPDVEPLVFHNTKYRFLTDEAFPAFGAKGLSRTFTMPGRGA
jgi:flavin reductase (DIM6/NTAB) family NADH-FMN oxidoreductase RutF